MLHGPSWELSTAFACGCKLSGEGSRCSELHEEDAELWELAELAQPAGLLQPDISMEAAAVVAGEGEVLATAQEPSRGEFPADIPSGRTLLSGSLSGSWGRLFFISLGGSPGGGGGDIVNGCGVDGLCTASASCAPYVAASTEP